MKYLIKHNNTFYIEGSDFHNSFSFNRENAKHFQTEESAAAQIKLIKNSHSGLFEIVGMN